MFEEAETFNQDLNAWDLGSLANIKAMFNQASNFNGDVSAWNTARVTNMRVSGHRSGRRTWLRGGAVATALPALRPATVPDMHAALSVMPKLRAVH